MKTITLISFLVTLTATAFNQVRKGQFLIGGNMNFESTKDKNSRNGDFESTNFFISPNIGYFIIDKLATGLRIDFRSYRSSSQNLETHEVVTSLSPFLRYYFLPLRKKVNAFLDLSYLHNRSKFNINSNSESPVKTNGYYFSGGPSIFLTDQIALEFTLGYKHTKSGDYGNTIENKFSSGFGLQIHFGKKQKRSH